MRIWALAGILAAIVVPGGARAQLVSESVQGYQRICNYAGPLGPAVASSRNRTYRVGIGQNCPGTAPSIDPSLPVPPSAGLLSSVVSGEARRCVYEQSGRTWSFNVPPQRYCPPAAGGLEQSEDGTDGL